MRKRFREIIDFTRQCVQELTGQAKSKQMSNSDLRGHRFASTPDPLNQRKRVVSDKFRKVLKKRRNKHSSSYTVGASQSDDLKIKIVPVAALFLVGGIFFFAGGPEYLNGMLKNISIFKVRTLKFEGCESASEQRLRQLTDISLYKTSLLGLDKDQIETGIEKDPWVSRAEVKRDWPSTLIVEVVEHRPIALVNNDSNDAPRLFYIDRKGVPFLEVKPGNDVDYPVITGLERMQKPEEVTGVFSDIYTFLRLVSKNDPNLPAQSVSEIHVNGEGEMVVYLVDHTFPIFFGRGQIGDKYKRLVNVLGALYREKKKGFLLSGVEYIRMDYLNDKVLVAQSESG